MEFRPPRQPLVHPGEMDCHVADMTATISAEVPLRVAQEKLAEFNQWIPIDGPDDWPVGKLVERNSTGPLRVGYGAWRDLLLGCQFTIARGDLITAGGRTMKNVAGYDLTKFMVGQRGIFGKIVTITVRTYRRPESALAARFDPKSLPIVSEILATSLRPRWAELSPDALWIGWLDSQNAIDLFTHLLAAHNPLEIQQRKLAEDIQHRQSLWPIYENGFRASVPPARLETFLADSQISIWNADAVWGIVIGPLESVDVVRLQSAATAVGGKVTIFRQNQRPDWQASPAVQNILAKLQEAF